MTGDVDQALEQLEAELQDSRFKPWDVETFLANRHRAKIDALTGAENKWRQRRQVAREMATAVLSLIGYVAIMGVVGAWALTGEFPLRRGMLERPAPIVIAPIPPMPICPTSDP